METNFIIIDDFLNDPDALRAEAMTLDYPVLEEETYYPGRNSVQRFPVNGLDHQVAAILGRRIAALDGSGHHRFRIALKDDVGKGGVHIDNSQWSGILYMTPNEFAEGGTNFYRHKATGMERAPLTAAEWEPHGFKDATDVWRNLIKKDTLNEDAWECTFHVPMRYNRLVLFRPWQWHNPTPGFGDSLENGRLVYLLFYVEV